MFPLIWPYFWGACVTEGWLTSHSKTSGNLADFSCPFDTIRLYDIPIPAPTQRKKALRIIASYFSPTLKCHKSLADSCDSDAPAQAVSVAAGSIALLLYMLAQSLPTWSHPRHASRNFPKLNTRVPNVGKHRGFLNGTCSCSFFKVCI